MTKIDKQLPKLGKNGKRFPAIVPFLDEIGIELVSMGNGKAEISLLLEERHLNSWHVAHGGVVLTMLDVAMSMAGRSLDPQARAGVTVEMKTTFMQPAGEAGCRIIATGWVMHRSTTLVFCEAEVRTVSGFAAKALGTFKYLTRLDVGRKLEQATSASLQNTVEPDVPEV